MFIQVNLKKEFLYDKFKVLFVKDLHIDLI